MIVRGPVPEVIWDGEVAAAGGEPSACVLEVFCRRERIEARTGSVSIESGERAEGRLRRGAGFVGGCWVVGELVIL